MQMFAGGRRGRAKTASTKLTDHITRRREDVSVEEVVQLGWRVRDVRAEQQNGHAMLGFIEQDEGVFEVIQLGEGFRLLTFGSFDEAVSHLVANVPEAPATGTAA